VKQKHISELDWNVLIKKSHYKKNENDENWMFIVTSNSDIWPWAEYFSDYFDNESEAKKGWIEFQEMHKDIFKKWSWADG